MSRRFSTFPGSPCSASSLFGICSWLVFYHTYDARVLPLTRPNRTNPKAFHQYRGTLNRPAASCKGLQPFDPVALNRTGHKSRSPVFVCVLCLSHCPALFRCCGLWHDKIPCSLPCPSFLRLTPPCFVAAMLLLLLLLLLLPCGATETNPDDPDHDAKVKKKTNINNKSAQHPDG